MNDFIFQREAKATKGREKGKKKNSKGRETEVASKQERWETCFKIIDYIYAVVFIYVYIVVHATISDSYLNVIIDLIFSLEEYMCVASICHRN